MGLFSSILRFGIQNGKKNLADVTALVLPEPPSIGFHSIEIHSNVDLDVHFGAAAAPQAAASRGTLLAGICTAANAVVPAGAVQVR